MIREIVAVGIGGALGSMSRYLVSYVWLAEQSLLGFPAGTFTVNAAGSLLMGFLLEMLGAGTASWLLSVGFCGGFTTFSTFSSDVVRMLKSGTPNGNWPTDDVLVQETVCCILLGAALGRLLKR